MEYKYFVFGFVFCFLMAFLAGSVWAQETADISYPVAELGNCQNQVACRQYCDKPENSQACLDFAKKKNLMSDDEVKKAEKFLAAEGQGPGGCKSKDACEAYCNNMEHMDECISFAEKAGFMSEEELAEAKKVQAAIKRGVKPPACGSKKSCDAYCESGEHMEECITFGMESGFLQGKELEDARKMLAAIKRGVKPLPCKGKEACDAYCNNSENMKECMNFALEAGFMSEEEKAGAQKMLQAIEKGAMPPPCKGKEECDAYCSQEGHKEECIKFFVAAGFMSEKDAEMMRQGGFGQGGPGGCKSEEECKAFCSKEENKESCMKFGGEKGSGQGPKGPNGPGGCKTQEECDAFCNNPANQEACMKFGEKNGMPPGSNQGSGPGAGGMMPPNGQTGPGGCKSEEECKAYCQNNPQNCQQFMPPNQDQGGQMNPVGGGSQFSGPGGCQGPEACQAYCATHGEECKNFQPPSMPPGSYNQQIPGQMQPPTDQMQPQSPIPCQGENCNFAPPSGGQMPPSGQPMPGGQPPMTPMEPQPMQPPMMEAPLPGNPLPSPTTFLSPTSLAASILNLFFVQH